MCPGDLTRSCPSISTGIEPKLGPGSLHAPKENILARASERMVRYRSHKMREANKPPTPYYEAHLAETLKVEEDPFKDRTHCFLKRSVGSPRAR